MTVEMKNSLTGSCTIVDAKPVAGLLETKFPRHIPCCKHEATEKLYVLVSSLRHIYNRLSRNHEKVCGSLRIDVLEGDTKFKL